MKKVVILVLCLALIYMIGAAASTYSANPGQVTIPITTTVQAGYTVEIPPDLNITLGSTATAFNLNISECKLDPGASLVITLSSSQNLLTNTASGATIPYSVLYNNQPFSSVKIAGAQSLPFTLSISESAWKSAPVGAYTGSIIFTFGSSAE